MKVKISITKPNNRNLEFENVESIKETEHFVVVTMIDQASSKRNAVMVPIDAIALIITEE